MSDFSQALTKPDLGENSSAGNGPNAFQAFSDSFWGPPTSRADQSGGAGVERVSQQFGGFQPQARIPEIPGVLTTLEGVTDDPKSEVTVQAKVAKILPDFDNPRNGLRHEQFIIEMADGTDVFVAHDLNFAPRVPLQEGEDIKLHGEWIPTDENHGGVDTIGVLHWTHHSEDENKHQSGWIEAGGQHYE